MGCLRCAGAPRRPATGSVLLSIDPSQHVVLYVPGEPLAAHIQFLRDALLPSPLRVRLGTPNVSRFRGLLVHHCYNLLSCLPPLQETFTSGLSTAWSPSPLPDMTTVATGQFPPVGLSPTGPTTSVAAPYSGLHSPIARTIRFFFLAPADLAKSAR
jgi:hypothetical protein